MSYKVGPLNRGKYVVTKANGQPTDPKACYFVLRLDTDPHARIAAARYARTVRSENPQLADDLEGWLAEIVASLDSPQGASGGERDAPAGGEVTQ